MALGQAVAFSALTLSLSAAARVYRRWHLRWGATEDEATGPMPGDDLVPKASFVATRALSIDAPPDRVWPWIVQVGYGRGVGDCPMMRRMLAGITNRAERLARDSE